jgi:urease accessory protein
MTSIGADGAPGALLRLLAWLSPAFPVGAFAYSHGIETAVEDGLVENALDLEGWIGAIVSGGSIFTDGVLLAHAWRAERQGDDGALAGLVARADALRGTAEAALESACQGRAFLTAVDAGWPHPRLAEFRGLLENDGREPAYAVAVGVAAALSGVPVEGAVAAFLHAAGANLVSAGVRLIPLGQRAGVQVLAALEPVIAATAAEALATGLEDLGTATWRVDLAMARHETQHVRLFRS